MYIYQGYIDHKGKRICNSVNGKQVNLNFNLHSAHDSKLVNFLSLYASIYHIHPCDLADSEELHHWVETVVSICILLFKLQTI